MNNAQKRMCMVLVEEWIQSAEWPGWWAMFFDCGHATFIRASGPVRYKFKDCRRCASGDFDIVTTATS